MISKIFGLFVITMTTNDKYSLHNREKLPQTIEMQLCEKQKTFSKFFTPFPKSTSNFETFGKKS